MIFILSIKYGLQILSVKATKTIINIAIVCYTIMFFYVLNINSEGNIIPLTTLLKSLSLFFFTTCILYLFSFLFVNKKVYESIIWSLASISSLLLAYVLIIFEYSVYLFKYFSQEQRYFIFNFILLFPLLVFTISLAYYIIKIHSGKAHKNDDKVTSLEKKYKEQSMNALHNLSKVQRHTVSIALIGVGLGGVLESSFTLFLFFFICAGIISWTTAKFLIVAFIKLKYPEQYLDENIKKMLKKERIQK